MKSASIILLLIFSQQLFAQNTVTNGKTMPLVGYWFNGASKKVTNTKVTSKVKKGITTSETITVKSLWQIKDSTEKSYTIHYTYNDFSFSNPNDSLNIVFAEIFKGITIRYRTNELGNFDTILNLNEIIALTEKGIDRVFKKLNWPENPTTTQIIDNIRNLASNPVMLQNSISEDMVLIHYFYGLEYTLNEPYSYDYYMANNLGGEPFPAKVTFKLSTISEVKDRANFIATITPDSKEYKRIIYESMCTFAEQMQIEKPSKKEFETSKAIHQCEAETSITEGWPVKVVFTKTSSIQDSKSSEVTTITFED